MKYQNLQPVCGFIKAGRNIWMGQLSSSHMELTIHMQPIPQENSILRCEEGGVSRTRTLACSLSPTALNVSMPSKLGFTRQKGGGG